MTINEMAVYGLFMLVVWLSYILIIRRKQKKVVQRLTESKESGMLEPQSLHPVIDKSLCLGCGACTLACPEGDILGLINGKAELVEPSHCIGHGACKAACPVDAITLVFGSEKRGVDIPLLSPDFETHMPGIFIAGELGGMGLIRNAIEQGVQAIGGVTKRLAAKHQAKLDLVIVGAGPAGIAAALEAKRLKLNFAILEQDSLGGTVAHFPRNKIVMTAPVNLPIIGKVRFKETTKESLLEFWESVIEKTELKIDFGVRMEGVSKNENGFSVEANTGTFDTRCVLLCLGRRGTPRKLGVPGEDLSKVVYRLIDAEQYAGQRVLVVGGGDSALEAAVSIAEQPNTHVVLSYRGDGFSRAKVKNRNNVDAAVKRGNMVVKLQSQVAKINPGSVEIKFSDKTESIKNDVVIVCAGGVLPTPLLHKIGIQVETKYGQA